LLAVEPLNLFSQNVDTNRPFQFQKRRQLFIRTHNEALPITAMRVNNPDRSPVGINVSGAALHENYAAPDLNLTRHNLGSKRDEREMPLGVRIGGAPFTACLEKN
jgi:hypothetical protein